MLSSLQVIPLLFQRKHLISKTMLSYCQEQLSSKLSLQ